MSYAKKGLDGSAVYVFTDGVDLACHGCTLDPHGDTWLTTSRDVMIDHLLRHRARGEHVPQGAIDRLRAEQDQASNLAPDPL